MDAFCSLQVSEVQRKELNIPCLYLHHTCRGPKANQETIINPAKLGETAVNYWTVYDGAGPAAKLVARAQGLHINAGLYTALLQVMGVGNEQGTEWAIVGGTGEFAMATGVIHKRVHYHDGDGDVFELTIKGFCHLPKSSTGGYTAHTQEHVHKIGTWGGNGGSSQDITEAPKHLESITIKSGQVVDSITFSYTDQAGQKHTVGPWGGPRGSPHTIQLDASEFVKEISGTYGTYDGATVITSFKLVTNVQTFGPWAVEKGTPFSVPVQSGSGIVGFFARAGKYLDAIGVHVTLV